MHIRSGPGVEYGSIGLLHRGDTVEVLAIDGNWAKIRHAGNDGWVHASFVAIQAPAAGQPPAPTPTQVPVPQEGEPASPTPSMSTSAADTRREPVGATADEDMRANVERILTLTEAMHHDLERRRNTLPAAASGRADGIGLQGGIGLLALGALVGFFIGTVVGRQQERRGRSRVRF